MKLDIRLFLAVLTISFIISVQTVAAQSDFDIFWKKFSSAVMKNEKMKVADLTKFPLRDESENDEGPNPSYSRTRFLRNYNYFFNQKMKKCLQHPNFYFNNGDKSERVLTCEISEYTNTLLMFKRMRAGWKWINFNFQ